MENLSPFLTSIQELCKLCGVKTLYAFGSVLTNRFDEESDIDLIVDLEENDPLEYTEKYFNLKFGLEKILGRTVDLLEERADLNPIIRKEIERSKVVVYEV
ncbi:MAG TPA: nucleotidyltransferase domain-containing protein [Algoriphagus sp.]|nr:nucleotidyltransferase domain-containing protein [Algoriphagus sp.]